MRSLVVLLKSRALSIKATYVFGTESDGAAATFRCLELFLLVNMKGGIERLTTHTGWFFNSLPCSAYYVRTLSELLAKIVVFVFGSAKTMTVALPWKLSPTTLFFPLEDWQKDLSLWIKSSKLGLPGVFLGVTVVSCLWVSRKNSCSAVLWAALGQRGFSSPKSTAFAARC